jgi:hypothetical protein
MMTLGGEHSEHDIPASIKRVKERYSTVEIKYVFPFELSSVARFLADQVKAYL